MNILDVLTCKLSEYHRTKFLGARLWVGVRVFDYSAIMFLPLASGELKRLLSCIELIQLRRYFEQKMPIGMISVQVDALSSGIRVE